MGSVLANIVISHHYKLAQRLPAATAQSLSLSFFGSLCHFPFFGLNSEASGQNTFLLVEVLLPAAYHTTTIEPAP
jgi:hypothetical protein